MFNSDIVGFSLFGIIIGIILFLFFREILCWYFKFTEMVTLLEKIEKNTNHDVIVHDKKDVVSDEKLSTGGYFSDHNV